ncbi:hypothetical protein BTVI_152372 [Pitangus sulphuratus]|nr:hypothetical protein BTVI_152372 [Pitangus sulphuratus]
MSEASTQTELVGDVALQVSGCQECLMPLCEAGADRRGYQCPELEDHGYDENDRLPVDLELLWDLQLQLNPNKFMGPDGIHTRILKELADGIARTLNDF